MTPGKRCVLCGRTAKEVGLYRLNSDQTCRICRPPKSRSASNKAWRQRNPDKVRSIVRRAIMRNRYARYGLTKQTFDERLAAQGNRCACCGGDSPRHVKGWCVDHDHETGVVRGIVCFRCNVTLGFLGDSLSGVEESARMFSSYLSRVAAVMEAA